MDSEQTTEIIFPLGISSPAQSATPHGEHARRWSPVSQPPREGLAGSFSFGGSDEVAEIGEGLARHGRILVLPRRGAARRARCRSRPPDRGGATRRPPVPSSATSSRRALPGSRGYATTAMRYENLGIVAVRGEFLIAAAVLRWGCIGGAEGRSPSHPPGDWRSAIGGICGAGRRRPRLTETVSEELSKFLHGGRRAGGSFLRKGSGGNRSAASRRRQGFFIRQAIGFEGVV